MSEALGRLVQWVGHVVEALGYGGLALLVALETVFPPLPSEAILPVAGFLAAQGRYHLLGVLAAATAGSLLGALVLYGLGRWVGAARVRAGVQRWGRWLLLDEADLDRAERWFQRHGDRSVFLGRLVPLIRSLISIPAGVARMRLWRFTLLTAAGSALWNGFLIGCGWALGEQWDVVRPFTKLLEVGTLAALGTAVLWFVWRRRARVLAVRRS